MSRSDILRAIADEVGRGELRFAGNTELALRVRRAIDDPDCHMEAAAKLIQAEPVLSAQVVAIANSVAYNPAGREITELKTAVTRLGFATLRNLVMAFVTRQMAGPAGSPEQRAVSARLWEHTTHVAALCRVLAKRVTGQNPDAALFVGLVHEIGGFYLLSRAGEHPEVLPPPPPATADAAPAEDTTGIEGELGLAVLHKLNVPESAIQAVADYNAGFLAMPARSLGDTLLLADYLSPVPSPFLIGAGADRAQAASVDLVLGEETLAEVLAESAEEVASISRALQA